jgi:hypothetical protein
MLRFMRARLGENMFGIFRKNRSGRDGPNFSEIDTPEKVRRLVAEGILERVLLLPAEFGGENVEPNIAHVPVGLAEIKADTDRNVILPLAKQGTVTRYVATPTYTGRSHVPTSIEIRATDPGDFTFELQCWGEGLKGQA